jgi:hypothetical protein
MQCDWQLTSPEAHFFKQAVVADSEGLTAAAVGVPLWAAASTTKAPVKVAAVKRILMGGVLEVLSRFSSEPVKGR